MPKIWSCKVGEVEPDKLPKGSDNPMRQAVMDTYAQLTGAMPKFLFSGWGAELTQEEREAVELGPRDTAIKSLLDAQEQDCTPKLQQAWKDFSLSFAYHHAVERAKTVLISWQDAHPSMTMPGIDDALRRAFEAGYKANGHRSHE